MEVDGNVAMLTDTEDTGGKLVHKSDKIAKASSAVTPSVNVNDREQAEAKTYKKKLMNSMDKSKGGGRRAQEQRHHGDTDEDVSDPQLKTTTQARAGCTKKVANGHEETRKNNFGGKGGHAPPPFWNDYFQPTRKGGGGLNPSFGPAAETYCQRAGKRCKMPENAGKCRIIPHAAKRRKTPQMRIAKSPRHKKRKRRWRRQCRDSDRQ